MLETIVTVFYLMAGAALNGPAIDVYFSAGDCAKAQAALAAKDPEAVCVAVDERVEYAIQEDFK